MRESTFRNRRRSIWNLCPLSGAQMKKQQQKKKKRQRAALTHLHSVNYCDGDVSNAERRYTNGQQNFAI